MHHFAGCLLASYSRKYFSLQFALSLHTLSFSHTTLTNKFYIKYKVQKIEQNYNQIRHEIKANKTYSCKLQLYRKDTDFFYMFLLEAVVLTGIVLGGMIRYWSQTIMLYCRLNSEFFACYKSMWHFDNYRYVSNPLSITFTFSLVKYDPYICNWTFVVLLYNYRVRETSYIVLNLL